MLANVGLAEAIALPLGAGCIAFAGVLVFRRPGGGSGTLKLPGIEISGRGSAALFLLVGAVLLLVAGRVGAVKGDAIATSNAATETGDAYKQLLALREDFINELETRLAKLPPADRDSVRAADPRAQESLVGAVGVWTGTLVRTQQLEGRVPELWPLTLQINEPLAQDAAAELAWDLPGSQKHTRFVVEELSDNVATLRNSDSDRTIYTLKLQGVPGGSLLLDFFENDELYARTATSMTRVRSRGDVDGECDAFPTP